MQNRYVGDIGDYLKYSLLRAVTPEKSLGVAWYLHPDEHHNKDGRYTDYLNAPNVWRHYDPSLFDALESITKSKERSVAQVSLREILPQCKLFFDEMLCCKGHAKKKPWCSSCSSNSECFACPSLKHRIHWRKRWFGNIIEKLDKCDIVFADPDNGLCLDDSFNSSRIGHWKRLPLSESLALANGRIAIIYHHNTRRPGGHLDEIQYWLGKLPKNSVALYCTPYNCRTFFIINPDSDVLDRAGSFARNWSPRVTIITS